MFIHRIGNYEQVVIYKDGFLWFYQKGADNKIHLLVKIESTEQQAKDMKRILTTDYEKKMYYKLPRRQVKRKLKIKGWAMSLKDEMLFEVLNPNYGKD